MKARKYFRLKAKWQRERLERIFKVRTSEPVDEVASEPVDEVASEPVDEVASEPVDEVASEHVDENPLFKERTLVREAAKKLGVSNKILIEKLGGLGVKVSHSSKAEPEILNQAAKEL